MDDPGILDIVCAAHEADCGRPLEPEERRQCIRAFLTHARNRSAGILLPVSDTEASDMLDRIHRSA